MNIRKTAIEPIIVTHLFPEMRAELLRVLESLTDDEWAIPTACEGWTVRDVACHLLGDSVGILSGMRDKDGQYFAVNNWQDLVKLIDAQNDLWVRASRRISRRLLISLLEFLGDQCHELFASLDPYQPSGGVGWTGNEHDPMWMHIARELTEYWMHHQHICEAVGKISLKSARYVHPVLSTFVHALPQTYQNVSAPLDTIIKFRATGEGGDTWYLIRETQKWGLYTASDGEPAASVEMNVDTAWHMFTKGISRENLHQQTQFSGDIALAEITLNVVAIIA